MTLTILRQTMRALVLNNRLDLAQSIEGLIIAEQLVACSKLNKATQNLWRIYGAE